MGARERRSASVVTNKPPVLLFHDEFIAPSPVTIYGTRPDTFNATGVTDTWHDPGYLSASGLYKYDAVYGGAYPVTSGNTKYARINSTKSDVLVEGGFSVSSDDGVEVGLMARITDLTDDGIPTHYVRAALDAGNNRIRLYEVVAGVNVQTVTQAVTLGATSHVLKLYCFGNQAAVMVGSTKSAVMTLNTQLSGTNVGFFVRRGGSGIFQISYYQKCYEIFDKGWT